MDIDYTVAALMFPAIPLMMTMYSNRFHTLSGLIRNLHDQLTFDKKAPPQLENQLHVLNNRTNLLKYTMGFAACCVCMIVSIFLFLQEIRLSNQALKYHLSDMDSMKDDL